MKKLFIILCLPLVLAACASSEVVKKSAAEIDYAKAKELLAKGNYSDVNLRLESFGSKHPYSRYTIQAELLRIFAAYKGGEYILSETLSKEFVRRHPHHPNADYAQYMLGMSHYREASPPEKDQSQSIAAIDSFKVLLDKYPKSAYARDGARHLQRLYNNLAKHELNVGKFYFTRHHYVAAANRFQVVLEKYQTTPAIEEALYYLAASYAKLGIKDESHNSALLLKHNYPKSEWSRKAARFL
jgi:outer membrane protein assembly factor BamD